jgi:hypothetical protein
MDEQFGRLRFPFRIDFSRLPDTDKTDPLAPFAQDRAALFLIEGLTDRVLSEGDQLDDSASERWEEMGDYRPKALQPRFGNGGLN